MKLLRERFSASFDGLSAESAAVIVVLGLVLGMFPVYGLPTILCALASIAFGLNLPAVQIVNQLATPLQWAMLVPFVKIGSRLIDARWSSPGLPWGSKIGALALQAVTGWLIVCLPLGVLLYALLLWLLRCPSTRQLFRSQAAFEAR